MLTRDLIDALPSTRNIMSVGMMVPGIRLGTPDVGGSRQMEQTNPRGHGIAAKHTVQHIDGMSVNSQETSNQQSYINDALSAEVSRSFTRSRIRAETDATISAAKFSFTAAVTRPFATRAAIRRTNSSDGS